jgi:hypothetical protein
MTLSEIKSEIGIEQFNLNTATTKDGEVTDWLRHWDNSKRVAVSIHKELFQALKSGSTPNLGIQEEIREGSKGEYKALRIVAFEEAEFTL